MRAACLTHVVARRQQDAHLGVRRHHIGDVTAFDDDATAFGKAQLRRLLGDVRALCGNEHMAHGDHRRHDRDMRADLAGTDGLTDVLVIAEHTVVVWRVGVDADVEVAFREQCGHGLGHQLLVHRCGVKIDALMQAPPCGRAVHGASVEVCEIEILRQRLGGG